MQQNEDPIQITGCRTQPIEHKNVQFPNGMILPSSDYRLLITSTYSNDTTETRSNSCAILTLYNALPQETRPPTVCHYLSQLRQIINNTNENNIPDYLSFQEGDDESIFTKFKNELNSAGNDLPIEVLEGVVRQIAPQLLPNYVIIIVKYNGTELVVDNSFKFLFYPNAESVNIDENTQIVFQEPGHYFGSKLGNNINLIPIFNDIKTQNIRNDEFEVYLQFKDMRNPDVRQQAIRDGWSNELNNMDNLVRVNEQRLQQQQQSNRSRSMSQTLQRKPSSSAAGLKDADSDDDDYEYGIMGSPIYRDEPDTIMIQQGIMKERTIEIQKQFDNDLKNYIIEQMQSESPTKEALKTEYKQYMDELSKLDVGMTPKYGIVPPNATFIEMLFFNDDGTLRTPNQELVDLLLPLGIVWKSKRFPLPSQQYMLGTIGVVTILNSVELSLKICNEVCKHLISSNFGYIPAGMGVAIRKYCTEFEENYVKGFKNANRDSLSSIECKRLCIFCVFASQEMEQLVNYWAGRNDQEKLSFLRDSTRSIDTQQVIKTTFDPSQLLQNIYIAKIPRMWKIAATEDLSAAINQQSTVLSSTKGIEFLKGRSATFNLATMLRYISRQRRGAEKLEFEGWMLGRTLLSIVENGVTLGDHIFDQIFTHLKTFGLMNEKGKYLFMKKDFNYGGELSTKFNKFMKSLIKIGDSKYSVINILSDLSLNSSGDFDMIQYMVLDALLYNYGLEIGYYDNVNANRITEDACQHDFKEPNLILALTGLKHSILAKIELFYGKTKPTGSPNINVLNGNPNEELKLYMTRLTEKGVNMLMEELLGAESDLVTEPYNAILKELKLPQQTSKRASSRSVSEPRVSKLLVECQQKVKEMLLGQVYQPFDGYPIEIQILFDIKASMTLHDIIINQLRRLRSNGFVTITQRPKIPGKALRINVRMGGLSDRVAHGMDLSEMSALHVNGEISVRYDWDSFVNPSEEHLQYYQGMPMGVLTDLEGHSTPTNQTGSGQYCIKINTPASKADAAVSSSTYGVGNVYLRIPETVSVYGNTIATVHVPMYSQDDDDDEALIFPTWNYIKDQELKANADNVSGMFYYFMFPDENGISPIQDIINKMPQGECRTKIQVAYNNMIDLLKDEIKTNVFTEPKKRKKGEIEKYIDEIKGRKKRYLDAYNSTIRVFLLNIINDYNRLFPKNTEENKNARNSCFDNIEKILRCVERIFFTNISRSNNQEVDNRLLTTLSNESDNISPKIDAAAAATARVSSASSLSIQPQGQVSSWSNISVIPRLTFPNMEIAKNQNQMSNQIYNPIPRNFQGFQASTQSSTQKLKQKPTQKPTQS